MKTAESRRIPDPPWGSPPEGKPFARRKTLCFLGVYTVKSLKGAPSKEYIGG
jgi:hypothetical protein